MSGGGHPTFPNDLSARRRQRRKGPSATVVQMTRVVKTYGARSLPVSGQEPPRLTKYERERMERRERAREMGL